MGINPLGAFVFSGFAALSFNASAFEYQDNFEGWKSGAHFRNDAFNSSITDTRKLTWNSGVSTALVKLSEPVANISESIPPSPIHRS